MFDLQLCQSSKHIKECNLFCSFAMTKLIYSSQFLKLWFNVLKIYIQIHKKRTQHAKHQTSLAKANASFTFKFIHSKMLFLQPHYITAKLQTGVKNVKHYYLMSFTYRSLSHVH